ncbi:MAG: DUF2207 domain-containing protein [Bacteroidales bacterium]|nr:DUF2207 domain-containing protein [Bacteroidales bacterium]
MKRWITLIAALVSTFAAFADEQKVHDLDITVTLYSHGVAGIHETWDLDTGNSITEWYLPRENLGDIEVFNLKVLDENYNDAQPFTDVGEWDVDLSRRQKTGKSGIVHKHNGVELCWGIGEYGHHVFHVLYGMKNVVKTLNDYDMFHMQLVNDELAAPPKHVRVTIQTDPASVHAVLDTTNTRVWGFGFNGTVAFTDEGTVVFESSEPFGYHSSVITLLRFNKGLFDSPSVQERDFQEVLDRAMAGADFGSDGDGYDDEDDTAGAIGGLIMMILSWLGIRKGFRKATGKVSKREKKKLLGVAESEINWYREIPMDGDLIAADYALSRLGEDRKQNALASAEILKMIYKGYLDVQKDASGNIEITFAKGKTGDGPIDSIASDLWSMMLEASGDDRILQDKEFSSWSSRNKKRLYNWTEKMATTGKSIFRSKGWMRAADTKFTAEGQLEAQHLIGFRKFLEDFTLTGVRETAEVHLWQDYLVYGALFGIADKVARQLKDIDPVLFERTVGYDYTTFNGALYSLNNLSRAITSANRSYVSSTYSSSSGSRGGYGGHSSFGGGGGFSGGGHGGGGR